MLCSTRPKTSGNWFRSNLRPRSFICACPESRIVMVKNLVIVESPAKAKTINKYLGKDFIVKSSIGHIRDLPTSGQTKEVDMKERAKAAAATRKLSPEEKEAHRKRKASEQL